ncbi:MAG: hypothetical protein RSD32_00925 [Oscillospiraceae bacterium]
METLKKRADATAGQSFVKSIRPLGAALFLLIFVLFLIVCFTDGRGKPLVGYVPPNYSEYYAQNETTLAELKTELEAKVFPKLEGIIRCELNPKTLTIIIEQTKLEAAKTEILRFYDESLFQFVGEEAS